MATIKEAKQILKELGLPQAQQNEMSALTLLALCGLTKKDSWSNTKNESTTVSKGVMDFTARYYGKRYAPNTRETFRRQVLHQFVQAGIINYNPDDPNLPTNSPRAHYGLTKLAVATLRTFGTPHWESAVRSFIKRHGALAETYNKKRSLNMVPITLEDGTKLVLSPGKHNEIQAAVVKDFAPRFAPGAKLLYLGDTAEKDLYYQKKELSRLGIPITQHDKLPDVVLFVAKKNWLFLVEVVTSHGPMTPKRIVELQAMLKNTKAGKVYVTAFPNFLEFRKHLKNIAWETEVWVADFPDHMIHYDGDKFMGPR